MSTLKLELLDASLQSNITHLRGLLGQNQTQFQRVTAIIDRLVAVHTTRANTKYDKMLENLRAKAQPPAPPAGSQNQGQSRRRDFQTQRTPQANQTRGGYRGSPTSRGRPKSRPQGRSQGQRAPSWTPQAHSNSDNTAMLSTMMSAMMAMMGQGQQPPPQEGSFQPTPPEESTQEQPSINYSLTQQS